ncbi:Bug family tripartite tricarboxylate transporter substrate binding protein [Falsiroseomonas oryzae]|uniref:Bug family tripartite tricarboxylate transporter substrate binding protein n=1 Tax=Falsiroseomonas oryzae TaxID=2766473 RepID=UPI0022EB5FAF|nr:tripartite tricarboxylate transporter substrate binding protein [Roseomonas sp. MO-31]
MTQDAVEVRFRAGRRGLLGLGLGFATLARPALAQAPWPARPVRMIVAYPAGGSTDIVARLLSERLARLWGQAVVVENRAGAAGTIGADSVAKAAPDGYTLLMAASPEIAIARSTLRNLPYDPVQDFAPINLLAQSPFLLVATPGINVSNLQELIALGRARPGTLNYASFGNGTSNHFVGELFKVATGLDITHVPYRGSGPMMTDLIAGTVQLGFDTVPAGLPHVRAGRLRAIGAAMLRRSSLAPEVPTLDEQGLAGFTGGSWVGLVAPARTPEPVVAKIAADVEKLMAEGFSRELEERGLAPEGLGPTAFRAFIEAEVVKWGDVARRAGIIAS